MAPKKRNHGQVTSVAGLGPRKQQRANARAAKHNQAGFPWLAGIVGGFLVLGAIALIVIAWQSSHQTVNGKQPGAAVNGILCESAEQTVVHYHAHLDLIANGSPMSVPAGIGFGPNNSCLYWLHTHDATGLIHIEAPASAKNRVFTLGDLFAVWGQPLDSQPLDSQHLGLRTLAPGETLSAYVDGKLWTGTLKSIPLKAHEEIALEITSGGATPTPPSSFNFPSGT